MCVCVCESEREKERERKREREREREFLKYSQQCDISCYSIGANFTTKSFSSKKQSKCPLKVFAKLFSHFLQLPP